MELVSNLEGKTSRFFYAKTFLGCPPHTSTSSACYGQAIRCISTKGYRCYPSPKEKHSYFINSNAVETFYLPPNFPQSCLPDEGRNSSSNFIIKIDIENANHRNQNIFL